MPSGAELNAEEGFTSAVTTRVAVEACRQAGLDGDGARLIRLGENALFRLEAHPVVIRIARSTEYLESAQGEVAVSRWLAGEGFPATRALDDLEQPVINGGHPVTFWHLIEESDRKPTYGELGAILRDLHSLSLPASLSLPPYPVLDRTDRRINAATGIPEDDRAFLRKRARELRGRVGELRFESRKGPVHGDAHVQNLMVDRTDRVILIDLERFGYDHPEWDLMVTATEHHSLGWQTPQEYGAFVGAYGRDLRSWAGFSTLRSLQEFNTRRPGIASRFARRR